MIKRLRRRLTFLCACITGVILCIMAVVALIVSEAQLTEQGQLAFQNNISTIILRLQMREVLDWAWLARSEFDSGMLIHVEENSHPFSFAGSWAPQTPRQKLISLAQDTAKNQYHVDAHLRPVSELNIQQAIFYLSGDQGEQYRAGVAILRTAEGYKSLTLLEDLRQEQKRKLFLRSIFAAIVFSGVLLLLAFSWWFSGRATLPIAESRKRQSEFIAAASHELRSPLTVIRTSAFALGLEVTGEPRSFVEAIDRECERTGRLVDDLLLLASVDAKSWSIVNQPVEIDTLLRETKEDFSLVAEKKDQVIVVELPPSGLPLLVGDEQRIRQILAILLDNALRYTPGGGKIILRGMSRPRRIRIQVADNGPGIADEYKSLVFGRFYQEDKSRSKIEHYGLGLSIARELVHLHRGKILLQDTDGGGLTVTIDLPLKEQPKV